MTTGDHPNKIKIKNQGKKGLVWIDLEMTGLDTLNDEIIEIATVVTDEDLNVLAEGPVFAIKVSDQVLNKMDDWNTKQHGQSGLVDRVRRSTVTLAEAEAETIKFLNKWKKHIVIHLNKLLKLLALISKTLKKRMNHHAKLAEELDHPDDAQDLYHPSYAKHTQARHILQNAVPIHR